MDVSTINGNNHVYDGAFAEVPEQVMRYEIARHILINSTKDFFSFCSCNKSFRALISDKKDLYPLFLQVFPAYREQKILPKADHLEIVKRFVLLEQNIKSANYIKDTIITTRDRLFKPFFEIYEGKAFICLGDDQIQSIDLKNPSLTETFDIDVGHNNFTSCLKIFDKRLYIGSKGKVTIWDLDKKEQITQLTGHRSPIRHINKYGNLLITTAESDTIIIWDLDKKEQIKQIVDKHREIVYIDINGTILFTTSRPFSLDPGYEKKIIGWDLAKNYEQIPNLIWEDCTCMLTYQDTLFIALKDKTVFALNLKNDTKKILFNESDQKQDIQSMHIYGCQLYIGFKTKIIILDLMTYQQIACLEHKLPINHTSMQFYDNILFLHENSLYQQQGSLIVWSLKNHEKLFEETLPNFNSYKLKFYEGKLFCSPSLDLTITIYDFNKPKVKV